MAIIINFGPGTTPEAGGTMPFEVRQAYDIRLLREARPALVHAQFCDPHPIDKRVGTTINMRRIEILAPSTVAATEGVTPDSDILTGVNVPITISQYIRWIGFSDLMSWVSIDDIIAEGTKRLAFDGARTVDLVAANFMSAGTAVQYANGRTSRGTVEQTDVFTSVEIKKSVRTLQLNYARAWDGRNYFSVIRPEVLYDLENITEWLSSAEYSDPERIYQGEAGCLYGVRFVLSPEGVYFSAAGASSANVMSSPIFGDGAFAKSEISGESMELIVHMPGSSGTADPANQRGTVAYKATFGGTVANNQFVVRVESGYTL
jgi:N4-gp56 family major capsid protein